MARIMEYMLGTKWDRIEEFDFYGSWEEFIKYLIDEGLSIKWDHTRKKVFVKNSLGGNEAILEYVKEES